VKPIPILPETLAVAGRVIWFEPPEKGLSDPVRFMAYAMRYALPEDMRLIRKYVSDDDFRDALDHAPPGIIDPRSWAYWNSKMGRYPPPPHPVRHFGNPTNMQNIEHEAQRRYGAGAWLREPDKLDPEEVRRRAAQRWRAGYGPK
jgi:hypothetical protein